MSDFGEKLHPNPEPIGKPYYRGIGKKRKRVQLVRMWREVVRPMVSRERDEVIGHIRFVDWYVKEVELPKPT